MAHLGGDVSEGGGISVLQSSLVVADSDLRGNVASGGSTVSRGGLISMIAPATVEVIGSALVDNRAALGGVQSLGGAVYAGGGRSRLRLASSSVMQNVASGVGVAAGGALYSATQVIIQIEDCVVTLNQADGSRAEGGAIWSAAESVHATNVTFGSNSAVAHGTDESALGGALFQQGLNATLQSCSITDNLARITESASRASGGAVHCATGAGASLVGCVFQGNAAGGKGKFQSQSSWYALALAEQLESSGLHIYSSGNVLMDRCRMIEREHLAVVPYAMWFWIVSEGGMLKLRNSVFETSVGHFYDACQDVRDGICNVNNSDASACPPDSDWEDCGLPPPPDAGPFGKLVNVRSPQAELVVRGSTVTNLTLKSASLIGAVNSSFEPPLSPSKALQPTSGSSACGQQLAGARLCDPRAKCEGAPSGGVTCSCVDAGLDFRPGYPVDGQRCQQRTSIDLLTQTRSVTISVQKPSFRADAIAVVFAAVGETGFTASYNMSMVRVRPTDGVTLQGPNSTRRGWSSINQQRMSMDGHHIIWQGAPPSADSAVDLNFDAEKFTFSRTFALSIELNCIAREPCIQDGDTVHTLVTSASASDGLVAEVMIISTIESLVSCNHSRSWIEGLTPDEQTVSALYPMKVRFDALDCDGLPIKYTRADVAFTFGNKPLAVTWNRGSNEYIADVPSTMMEQPGAYKLVVSAINGWDSTSSRLTTCVVLSRTIEVVQSVNLQPMIVAVSVAGSLIALVAVVSGVVLRWYRIKLQHESTRLAARRAKAFLRMSRLWDHSTHTWMPAVLVTVGPIVPCNPSESSVSDMSRQGSRSTMTPSRTLRVPSLSLATKASVLQVDLADKYGYLPLHYAVSEGAPVGMVERLIAAFPKAAAMGDAKQNLPLHLALNCGADSAVVKAVYAAFAEGVLTANGEGQLPIQLLVQSRAYAAHDVIELAQLIAFPIDCNGRCANWFYLLQQDETHHARPRRGSKVESAIHRVATVLPGSNRLRREPGVFSAGLLATSVLVSSVLDIAPQRSVTVEALARATDKSGRLAIEVATHANKRCLWLRLFLLGRYEKKKLLHESATSRVWEVEDKEAEHEHLKVLALKEIQDEAHYERETSVRAEYALSEDHVVQVVRCHAQDRILLMENGHCSLEDALCNQNIAAVSPSIIRMVIDQLAMSLMHLHSRGILHRKLHGDMKAKNVCLFRSSWKLIDFDSAVRIGGTVGAKIVPGQSPSNAPPELARLLLRNSHSAKAIRARLSSDKGLSDAARHDWETCRAIVEHLDSEGLDPLACTLSDAAPSFDVWGFGLILYRLFTAFRLFNTDQQDELDEEELCKLVLWQGVRPVELRKRVFAKVTMGSVASSEKDAAVQLISACLHPDPMRRPQSVEELLKLDYFQSHSSVHKAKVLFVSTPGRGRNPWTGDFDVDVMGWLQKLCRHHAGAFVVAYDWAGSSSADPRDTKWFNQIFEDRDAVGLSLFDRWRMAPTEEDKERLIDTVQAILSETRWLASYKGSIKAQIREACQSGAKAILVRLEGGPITRVEARLMAQLIGDAKADLAQLGVSSVNIELHAYESVFDFANALATYTCEVYGEDHKPIPAYLLAALVQENSVSDSLSVTRSDSNVNVGADDASWHPIRLTSDLLVD
jgi:serine/threonine protein kinase